jgi:hypothetical protein
MSVILAKSVLLDEEPVVPIAFLFHDTKEDSVHDYFFAEMKKVMPGLNTF